MRERILIIEDEEAIRSILRELLLDAGYEVEEAADGPEGIAKFRAGRFVLVLLDLMLPGLDGYAVCEQIRRVSDIPVIMLTALDGEDAQIKAFELQADDYITKPFSLRLVLMRIEAVLRRSREPGSEPEPGDVLTHMGVTLDTTAHASYYEGRRVTLTPTEYALLELFMRNPSRVFTRDNLLDQVWGYDFSGEEKIVNVHIMYLRRKLGAKLIETVRGVGYRLGQD